MKKYLLAIACALSMNCFANEVVAIPYNTSGHVGEKTKIECYFKFEVKNDSSRSQNYMVMEKFSVDGKEDKKGWGFSLSPHETKSFDEIRSMDYTPTSTGKFDIEGNMSVAGQPSLNHTGHATLEVK